MFSSAPTGSSLVWSALWARIVVYCEKIESTVIAFGVKTTHHVIWILYSLLVLWYVLPNQPFNFSKNARTFLVPEPWYSCNILIDCTICSDKLVLSSTSILSIETSWQYSWCTKGWSAVFSTFFISLMKSSSIVDDCLLIGDCFFFAYVGRVVLVGLLWFVFIVRLHAPIPNHANQVWKHWFALLGTKDPLGKNCCDIDIVLQVPKLKRKRTVPRQHTPVLLSLAASTV